MMPALPRVLLVGLVIVLLFLASLLVQRNIVGEPSTTKDEISKLGIETQPPQNLTENSTNVDVKGQSDHDVVVPGKTMRPKTQVHSRWGPQLPFHDNATCLTDDNVASSSWERRAPAVVLLGAMKGGTSALSYYLRQHPRIAKAAHKETHFLDLQFSRYATPTGIRQRDGQKAYVELMYRESIGDLKNQSSNLIALDDSPRYLFWSTLIPPRLFCVAPWVKLLVLLRDPIDRAYSHFNMQVRGSHRNSLDFDEWIQQDLQRMRSYGLVKDWTDQEEFEAFSGSQQEREAWKQYTGEGSGTVYKEAVLGKSMYVVQLRHWLQAMDSFGKPRSDLLILRSEQLKHDTAKVVDRVFEFLEMPADIDLEMQQRNSGLYRTKLKNSTRQLLQHLFEPYNRQLYKLLGSEWDGIWDA